ncbi:hypothetical protein ACQZV8_16395, partial [Magnetococcales bacterium HHB-1]
MIQYRSGLQAQLFQIMAIGSATTFLMGVLALTQLFTVNQEMNRISTGYLPMVRQMTEIEQKMVHQTLLLKNLTSTQSHPLSTLKQHYWQLEEEKNSAFKKSHAIGIQLINGVEEKNRPSIQETLDHLNRIEKRLEKLKQDAQTLFDQNPKTSPNTQTVILQSQELSFELEQLLLHLEGLTQKSLEHAEEWLGD